MCDEKIERMRYKCKDYCFKQRDKSYEDSKVAIVVFFVSVASLCEIKFKNISLRKPIINHPPQIFFVLYNPGYFIAACVISVQHVNVKCMFVG